MTIAEILAASKCFCLNPGQSSGAVVYLLDQILSTNPFGPTTGTERITEEGATRITEEGETRITE